MRWLLALLLFNTLSINTGSRHQAAQDLLLALDIGDIYTKLKNTQRHIAILKDHQDSIRFHINYYCKGCSYCSHDNSYDRFFTLGNKARDLREIAEQYHRLIAILMVYKNASINR
ncbi:hypothetical protein H0X48_03615 [Candidatus Dependentiae bacterium]|nr:hypothetical protein [Candidatus Dependentiae bacterium]